MTPDERSDSPDLAAARVAARSRMSGEESLVIEREHRMVLGYATQPPGDGVVVMCKPPGGGSCPFAYARVVLEPSATPEVALLVERNHWRAVWAGTLAGSSAGPSTGPSAGRS